MTSTPAITWPSPPHISVCREMAREPPFPGYITRQQIWENIKKLLLFFYQITKKWRSKSWTSTTWKKSSRSNQRDFPDDSSGADTKFLSPKTSKTAVNSCSARNLQDTPPKLLRLSYPSISTRSTKEELLRKYRQPKSQKTLFTHFVLVNFFNKLYCK